MAYGHPEPHIFRTDGARGFVFWAQRKPIAKGMGLIARIRQQRHERLDNYIE
jgi:hypothetical protein